MWNPSCLTRNQSHILCIGRQIHNHWTSREVLSLPGFPFLTIIITLTHTALSRSVNMSWNCEWRDSRLTLKEWGRWTNLKLGYRRRCCSLPVFICALHGGAIHSVKNSFANLLFPGGSDGKESACNAGDLGLIPALGRSPAESMVSHSSILAWRIPMDRGAWWL